MGYLKISAKGATWIGALKFFSRASSILRTLVIARILSPSQFGIFGIATLSLSLVEIFTETGINVVLVQKKENIDNFINTAWAVSIIRGVLIFLLIFISADFVSSFFKSKESYSLLVLVSLVPLVRGFINPAIVKFQKDLKFHKEFYYRSSILTVETLASLLLVFLTKDPISLVWGMLIGAFFEVIISFIVAQPFPRVKFNKEIFKEIISQSKWITSSGIFNYLFSNGDNIMVGRVMGTSSLGIYDMAYNISLLPTTEIAEVVSKVTFPVYVQISDDRKRLRNAYLKTTFLIAALTTPIALAFLLFPSQLITIFLGEKWISAARILQVLSVFAFIIAVFSPVGSVFYAVKKQKYNFAISLIAFSVMIIIIYPLITQWGLVGAGIAAIIGSLAPLPLLFFFLYKIFNNK